MTKEIKPAEQDRLALIAALHSQNIINDLIDEGFITDLCIEKSGHLGFSYYPKRFSDRSEVAS